MTYRKNLTAGELIAELGKIPGETILTAVEHDSEWMRSYVWSVSGVTKTGVLISGNLLESYDDFEEDFDD